MPIETGFGNMLLLPPLAVKGHKDVKTTLIYTYVLNRGDRGVISPLDA